MILGISLDQQDQVTHSIKSQINGNYCTIGDQSSGVFSKIHIVTNNFNGFDPRLIKLQFNGAAGYTRISKNVKAC